MPYCHNFKLRGAGARQHVMDGESGQSMEDNDWLDIFCVSRAPSVTVIGTKLSDRSGEFIHSNTISETLRRPSRRELCGVQRATWAPWALPLRWTRPMVMTPVAWQRSFAATAHVVPPGTPGVPGATTHTPVTPSEHPATPQWTPSTHLTLTLHSDRLCCATRHSRCSSSNYTHPVHLSTTQ